MKKTLILLIGIIILTACVERQISKPESGIKSLDAYNSNIAKLIHDNWILGKDLTAEIFNDECRVILVISKTGEIMSQFFEQRAVHDEINQSVLKAIEKSKPLPPLPEGHDKYTIGLVFTPKQMK